LDGLSESLLFEAEVLGKSPVDSGSACPMPVEVQIQHLRREIANRPGADVPVLSVDLYSLEGDERHAAIDAMVAGEASPFVLLDGRVLCAGSVEIAMVLEALDAAGQPTAAGA